LSSTGSTIFKVTFSSPGAPAEVTNLLGCWEKKKICLVHSYYITTFKHKIWWLYLYKTGERCTPQISLILDRIRRKTLKNWSENVVLLHLNIYLGYFEIHNILVKKFLRSCYVIFLELKNHIFWWIYSVW